ncbi:major facilitator superfamily domain-containing protein 6-like isoform X2 [Ornithodoros turicata]|uniref:major facilitator superfamily domain-containing protein 6-like isoform X2 n=1 Tax=Ornithodoros turicata TaxID=34597 RepID=UPI0031397C71
MITVRWKEVPMKAHYFFYYSALSGFLPFIGVLAKDKGVSAAEVGLIYTIAPFFSAASKPIFGAMVDHTRKMKTVLLAFVIVVTLSFGVINFIPVISKHVLPLVTEQNAQVDIIPSLRNQRQVALTVPNMTIQTFTTCDATCLCSSEASSRLCSVSQRLTVFDEENRTFLLPVTSDPQDILSCNVSCTEPSEQGSNSSSLTSTYFWIFFVFITVNYAAIGCANSLTDASCFDLLECEGADAKDRFGLHRLWGTVGWGIFTPVSGYMIDWLNYGSGGAVDYSAGFYLCAALMAIDVACIWICDIKKTRTSQKIVKDVTKMLLHNRKVVVLLLDATMGGIFVGIVWQYHFWYLKHLGASQGVMGATVAVRSFGELPIFFCAGWLIRKTGHVVVLRAALLSMAVTFGLYSIIVDPWVTLPVELLLGLALGAFFTAMPSYAEDVAPPGTEATTLGLVTGFFEGIGTALGGMVGGAGFEWFGSRATFQVVGMAGFLWCLMVHLFQEIRRRIPCGNAERHATKAAQPLETTEPATIVQYTAVSSSDMT